MTHQVGRHAERCEDWCGAPGCRTNARSKCSGRTVSSLRDPPRRRELHDCPGIGRRRDPRHLILVAVPVISLRCDARPHFTRSPQAPWRGYRRIEQTEQDMFRLNNVAVQAGSFVAGQREHSLRAVVEATQGSWSGLPSSRILILHSKALIRPIST